MEIRALFCSILFSLSFSCALEFEVEDVGNVGNARSMISSSNAVSWNAVSWNAVSWNAVSWNAVSWNAVSWNAVSWNAVSWNAVSWNALSADALSSGGLGSGALAYKAQGDFPIETVSLGRQVLDYLVRCAFEPGERLSFEADGTTYEYVGVAGLAPGWKDAPLSESEARLVSACVLAHVNAYGESVQLSVRSHGVLHPSKQEKKDYPVYEGTFFGNVFEEPMRFYSCQGDDSYVAGEQSPDRALRTCADPSEDCGVVSLGRCRDVCETRGRKTGWRDCWADGVFYSETVSAFLAPDDSDFLECGDGWSCAMGVSGSGFTGHIDCEGADSCEVDCKKSAICNIDCSDAESCEYKVKKNAYAEINCNGVEHCEGKCLRDSWCEVDCLDAESCDDIYCKSGAECLLSCAGAAECGFAKCVGGELSCPGDIVVCNRECP